VTNLVKGQSAIGASAIINHFFVSGKQLHGCYGWWFNRQLFYFFGGKGDRDHHLSQTVSVERSNRSAQMLQTTDHAIRRNV